MLISVIVPVYKVEQYLDKCVKSLIDQTYKDIEIILVDDGSPDNCPAMCDKYAAEYENVVTFHKPNGGLGDARNYGVKRAKADHIVFVDSDDYVEPVYVENMVRLYKKFNADIAITRVKRENEGEGPRIRKVPLFEEHLATKEQAIFTIYAGDKVSWSAYGKLYKKEMLLKHPFPDGWYEDAAVMYLILDECERVAIGDHEGNYHYIAREGSILNRKLKKEHMHIFDICDVFSEYINKNYRNISMINVLFYRKAVTQMLNLQPMSEKAFNMVYCRYRKMFRKNIIKIMKSREVTVQTKYYTLMLCLTPSVYRLQYKAMKYLRRKKCDHVKQKN